MPPLQSATGGERPRGRFASPLLPIFLIVAVDILGFTIILPLLPFYSEHLGASPAVVGALVSTYAACQLIAGPILGQLSDRLGRRPILLVSQLGTLAGFLVLAFSNHIWMLFLARAIDGATAGNLTIAQAYISDVTKPEDRAKSFAIIGIAFGFGFLVGPAIAGFLAHFGYQAPIFAASALSFTTILCTFFLLPRREVIHEYNAAAAADPGPGGRRLSLISWGEYRVYFKDRDLARLLMQWLLFSFSFSTFISGFALFAERRYFWNGHPVGVREVGYIFAFTGFLGIIMQGGVVGRLVKRFGERKVVRIGFISSALGYAAVGLTRTVGQLLWVNGLSSVGGAGLRPALTSLITQKAGKREQGSHPRSHSVTDVSCPNYRPAPLRHVDRSPSPHYLGHLGRCSSLRSPCFLKLEPPLRRLKETMPLPKLRGSEWVLLGFFAYIVLVSHWFPSRPHLQNQPFLILLVTASLLLFLSALETQYQSVAVSCFRDFLPALLTLVAFREMELFLPVRFDGNLERSWIGWDRLLLSHWHLRALIESLGSLIPFYLELCYLLVYGLPIYCIALLYAKDSRRWVDRFLTVYLVGTLAAYAFFPYFPSQPPRIVFPGMDSPAFNTVLRRFNLAVLRAGTIHVGVFPSAHVSSAFSAAWGMFLVLPKRKLFGWTMLVYAVSVSIATIYGRYHYTADVLAGFAVSLLAAGVARIVYIRSQRAGDLSSDPLVTGVLPNRPFHRST